ncbi:MAG: YggS family pyridoxal phosphate-dependent enzyme [Candidatus Thioglobus sp.]|nr:YggS family pyridoxal phosphate-dependent enzyme [Candidatus Thioglobus sp.]
MIKANLANIRTRIGAENITLIAVSKGKSVDELQEAIACGQRHFGENYLQEALAKIDALQEQNADLIWHFIGPIQSNKTAKIAQNFDWVQSVDRLKIAKRLSQQRPDFLGKLNILLQINIDNEPTKSGVLVDEITDLVKQIQTLKNLNLAGFMCIPEPQNSAKSFAKMAVIFEQYPHLKILSMGMSNDFEIAIKNGANFVRIGTDIFGKR